MSSALEAEKLDSIDRKLDGQATETTLDELKAKYHADTATLNLVPGSDVSVELVAANAVRKGLILYNNSRSAAFVTYGDTSSSLLYTHRVAPGGFWSMNFPIYRGVISCVWDVADGGMMVTELI